MSDEPTLADRLAGCLKGRSSPWRGYRAVRVKDIREAVEALREADQWEKDAYEKGWQNGLAYGETRHR